MLLYYLVQQIPGSRVELKAVTVQGVVTPAIGPVLTSASAENGQDEIKEWSSGQGSLEPL